MVGRILVQGSTGLLAADKTSSSIGALATVVFGVALLGLLVARWFLLLRQLSLVRVVNSLSDNPELALKVVSSRQGALISIVLLLVTLVLLSTVACGTFIILSAFLFKRGSPLSFIPILVVYGSMFTWMISLAFIHAAGFLVFCAAVCEKQRISKVIGKGLSLSGRSFLRTLLGGFLIMVTIVVMGPPLWLPVFIICVADAFRMGYDATGGAIPFHWQVLWSTWESLIDMIVWPICFIFFGLYYADMKIRQEGQDLADNLAVLRIAYEAKEGPNGESVSTA